MLFCATLSTKSIPLWVSVWVRWLTHVFRDSISQLKVRKTTVFWVKNGGFCKHTTLELSCFGT